MYVGSIYDLHTRRGMEIDRKLIMKCTLLLIAEMCIILSFAKIITVSELYYQNISATDLIVVSDKIGASYDDEGITAYSPEQDYLEDAEIMSCGPYITLEKGSYDITIMYETDSDANRFEIHCGESRNLDALFHTSLDGYLTSCNTQNVSHIRALKDIDAFDVQVLYQGVGRLSLKGIVIQQTNADVKYKVISLALLMLLIDVLLIMKKRVKCLFSESNYKYTVSILALSFFSSLLIWVNGYYGGHDLIFHMLRIEGIKEALLSGQFPARIDPTHLRGYGYATATMYPNLFLYFPAVLRILGLDMINSYKCFVFGINLLTALATFYALQGIFKDRSIALTGTILYVLAPYRIMDLYYRAAVGEYCALIGLPLIAYGLYSFVNAYRQKDEEPKWIPLALGYSIVLETHIITTFIVGLFSVIIGILFMKSFLEKKNMFGLLKSFFLTIGLNLWFIVPFLDYYRLPMNKAAIGAMNENGITIAQLFQQQVLADFPIHSTTLEQGIAGEIPYSIGYGIVVAVFFFVLFLREERKYRKLGLYSMGLGVFAVVCSTYSFPWDKIIEKISVFGNVQFPWRYLEIALICFVICACIGIEAMSLRMNKYVVMIIIIVLAIASFTAMTDIYLQKAQMNTYVSLNTFEIGNMGEYLLNGTDTSDLKECGNKISVSSEYISFQNYNKTGTNVRLDVLSESDTEQFVELPLLMYPGYCAKSVRTSEKLTVTYGNNNIIRVMIPSRFQDTITLNFVGKWYWKISEIISVIVLLTLIVVQILKKRHEK